MIFEVDELMQSSLCPALRPGRWLRDGSDENVNRIIRTPCHVSKYIFLMLHEYKVPSMRKSLVLLLMLNLDYVTILRLT